MKTRPNGNGFSQWGKPIRNTIPLVGKHWLQMAILFDIN